MVLGAGSASGRKGELSATDTDWAARGSANTRARAARPGEDAGFTGQKLPVVGMVSRVEGSRPHSAFRVPRSGLRVVCGILQCTLERSLSGASMAFRTFE